MHSLFKFRGTGTDEFYWVCSCQFVFLKALLKNKDYLILLFSILTFSLILIFFIDFLKNDTFQRLINTNYIASLEILKNFILFIELPERHTIDDPVLSLWYRLSLWEKLIQPYFSNFYTVVFGNGTNAIYYELQC